MPIKILLPIKHTWYALWFYNPVNTSKVILHSYLIETPFKAFANRADPDQAALIELPDQGLLAVCFWKDDWICSYTSGSDK